jgi:hypothetical protein
MNSRTKLRNIPHIRSNSSEKSTSFNGKAGDHSSSTLSSRLSALDMTRGGMGARNDKGVSLRIGSGDVVVAGTSLVSAEGLSPCVHCLVVQISFSFAKVVQIERNTKLIWIIVWNIEESAYALQHERKGFPPAEMKEIPHPTP